MSVLVLGGTGTVGSQVVRDLIAKKVPVRILTRSPEKAAAAPKGADAVVGNLQDPTTIRSVFKGAEGVLLLNAVSLGECSEGLMAVNGAVMGHVRRVVYVSVQHADKAVHLPHFGSKVPVEMALAKSGLGFTILRPNNFYQNDFWFKDVLLQHGTYPQPIGDIGVSRVDVRDIADIAVAAFTASGREHEGQTYNLVGPDVWTGARTAEVWSKALGKPVAYGGNDLDAWEQQQLQWLPPWLVFDFKLMYKVFQEQGLLAGAGDIEKMSRIMGHPPRSYEAFVTETVASWR